LFRFYDYKDNKKKSGFMQFSANEKNNIN